MRDGIIPETKDEFEDFHATLTALKLQLGRYLLIKRDNIGVQLATTESEMLVNITVDPACVQWTKYITEQLRQQKLLRPPPPLDDLPDLPGA